MHRQKQQLASTCRALLTGLLLLTLWPLSTLAEEEAAADDRDTPRVALISRGADYQGELLMAQFPEQARWIEGADRRFPALMLRETTATRQGAALIVADAGQSPGAGLTQGIRASLPDGGWRTLAISLPSDWVDPLPERVFGPRGEVVVAEEADAADDGDEADNGDEPRGLTIDVMTRETIDEATLEAYQARAMARVDAAVADLRRAGFENLVLIGIGEGADIGTRYLLDNPVEFQPGGIGLVWVAPRFRAPLDEALGETLGRGWEIPVLDLTDSRHDRIPAAKRKASANRARFENYNQHAVPLTDVVSAGGHKRIGHRIRGWLKANMLGMEL